VCFQVQICAHRGEQLFWFAKTYIISTPILIEAKKTGSPPEVHGEPVNQRVTEGLLAVLPAALQLAYLKRCVSGFRELSTS
jgi:hypothetical protein